MTGERGARTGSVGSQKVVEGGAGEVEGGDLQIPSINESLMSRSGSIADDFLFVTQSCTVVGTSDAGINEKSLSRIDVLFFSYIAMKLITS